MAILTLVGFMGAGKTSVGLALSNRTGIPFLDLDTQIERRTSRSIEALFAELGESGFRRLEAKELARAVRRRKESLILATGGGVVESGENRELLLTRSIVVWLDASYRVSRARTRSTRRPLAGTGLRGRYRARYRLYAEAAIRVRSDRGTPEEVAGRVISALSRRGVSWP